MDRRSFMASAGVVALSASLPGYSVMAQSGTATAGGEGARLKAMLDRFFYGRLEDSPERATGLGLDKDERAHLRSRLSDYSAAGEARELARSKAELAELRSVDRDRLSYETAIDYDVVAYGDRKSTRLNSS